MYEYHSTADLYELIAGINRKYYMQLLTNILYLEEYLNKNLVVYLAVLRDTHAHISVIFNCLNVLDSHSKEIVQIHLGKYSGHLERGVLDTFAKIASIKKHYLLSICRNRSAMKAQLAQKVSQLRVITAGNDEKIEKYKELIHYLDEATDKISTKIE
jgi:hypothetical protein